MELVIGLNSIDKQLYKNMRLKELSLFATKDQEAIRFKEEKEDIRPPFFRDIDRIIYSLSYTRYMDKTQVFSFCKNDHITKRMVHVQLVSKIARTIGRALNLNEDLIEAAALGHDLGHVPFGHVGEAILNEISLKYGEGFFHHNIQSVRMLMEVEHGGIGRNLTIQVLDAIMCHNGEFVCKEYRPQKKTKEQFWEEYQNSYHNHDLVKKLVPMTLEGCVVRISDMIAYLGRDIEDACMLKVFDKKELPQNIVDVFGSSNREIINTIIMDVIRNSVSKNCISMSLEIYEAMKELKKFNMQRIYIQANDEHAWNCYRNMFEKVFSSCVREIQLKNKEAKIYIDFLNYRNENYQNNNSVYRIVIDYIAGMTDNYLEEIYSYYKMQENG